MKNQKIKSSEDGMELVNFVEKIRDSSMSELSKINLNEIEEVISLLNKIPVEDRDKYKKEFYKALKENNKLKKNIK